MVYPLELDLLPSYENWLPQTLYSKKENGENIDLEAIQLSLPLALKATSYQVMYAYGNHIRVKSVETNLVTMCFGVAITFTTMCKSNGQDSSPIKANLEYVGWFEEILELDYGTTCVIVLFCKWVKANYKVTRMTMKRDEYGFTLVNFNEMLPFSKDFFAFPIHLEQIFFSHDPSELRWKVVLNNEPQGKQIENAKGSGPKINLLTIGSD